MKTHIDCDILLQSNVCHRKIKTWKKLIVPHGTSYQDREDKKKKIKQI